MDGVLIREEHAVPGAMEFLARLIERGKRFLVLTNNSIFTPRDLAARLAQSGLDVPEGVDLDVGAGDGNISSRSTSARVRVRHR